jgi:hypothetical protein
MLRFTSTLDTEREDAVVAAADDGVADAHSHRVLLTPPPPPHTHTHTLATHTMRTLTPNHPRLGCSALQVALTVLLSVVVGCC